MAASIMVDSCVQQTSQCGVTFAHRGGMGFDTDQVLRMLETEVDVIGAICPQKKTIGGRLSQPFESTGRLWCQLGLSFTTVRACVDGLLID